MLAIIETVCASRDLSQLQQVVQQTVTWLSKCKDHSHAGPSQDAEVRYGGHEGLHCGLS